MKLRVLCLLVVAGSLLLGVVGVAQAIMPNNPPFADPNGPYTGTVGVPVTFDGTGSYDPDGDPITYEWDFGDGSPPVTGPTASHTYSVAAYYSVRFTVEDDKGGMMVVNLGATITEANGVPEFSFTLPVLTSLAAVMYLALRKRIGRKPE